MKNLPVDANDADRTFVEHERKRLREFVEGLSSDDIKSGERDGTHKPSSGTRRGWLKSLRS